MPRPVGRKMDGMGKVSGHSADKYTEARDPQQAGPLNTGKSPV